MCFYRFPDSGNFNNISSYMCNLH
ncbi:hypothetical protein CP082626L3_0704A, partial [Chlamydia psittaci 08-2626_L3]